MKKKSLIWILASALTLIIVLVLAGRSKSGKGIEVTAVNPITKTITEIIPANGKIQPVIEVKISPDVSGEIVRLNVQEGDMVHRGDLLIQIKQDQYASARDRYIAAVNQAKAQLAQQKAQFAQIELSYNRNKKLYEQRAISEADYEKASSEYQVAKEQIKASEFNVQSAEASLAEAQESLVKTTIYAPMDGIVSKLSVERGERVVGTSQMAGTEMLRIANFDQMEVLVDVNENDIVRIETQDTATIEVDAYPGRTFTGVVTQIANSAKNIGSSLEQVTNFEVKVYILPSSYQDLLSGKNKTPFRPGMSASVSIQTQTKENALAIPIQSVTARPELIPDSLQFSLAPNEVLEQVFVVRDNKAELVRVASGIQDHNHIEILSGLSLEDLVITGPYAAISKTLRSGSRVKVKATDR